MKVALIAPTPLLYTTTSTRYFMVLPHMLEDPNYLDFYQMAEGYKILDNGEAEVDSGHADTAYDKEDLINLAKTIGAHEIVVPDVMGDMEGTLQRVEAFESTAKAHPQYTYMGVAQGKTYTEMLECIKVLARLDWIEVLALPRYAVNHFHTHARLDALRDFRALIDKQFKYVHCLGMGNWIREVVMLAENSSVRGIDTSLPYSMALAGASLNRGGYLPRQKSFFQLDRVDPSVGTLASFNASTFCNWAVNPDE